MASESHQIKRAGVATLDWIYSYNPLGYNPSRNRLWAMMA
jgi:hypothetical protein